MKNGVKWEDWDQNREKPYIALEIIPKIQLISSLFSSNSWELLGPAFVS